MSGGKEIVLQTLKLATSQDFEVLKPAEIKLQGWEVEPGFYSTLMEIFSEYTMEVNVRWLAVLYFKNGVDRYWRRTANNAIPEDEKVLIRAGLLRSLKEPVPQIALQIAVLISKIGRIDFPIEWPDLLPTLFEGLKVSDELVVHRALLTLHHVIKQLSSKRLPGDRRKFQDLTSEMFLFLLQLWQSQTEEFVSRGSFNEESSPYLERSHLCLKILRKLVIYGFKKPEESAGVVNFIQNIFLKINLFLGFRKITGVEGKGVLEKYIVLLTKVLADMQAMHPFGFVPFIKLSLELGFHYIFVDEGYTHTFTRFTIQCLNLMKYIIMCAEYKRPKVIEATVNPETLRASEIKTEFFSEEVVVCICKKLVLHFFPLTREDLEMWDRDPEGFSLEIEGGESWKYSLRPCTESLFDSLFYANQKVVTATLLELCADTRTLVPADDFDAICRKDAVYNAIGLASFQLWDDFDFDELFKAILVEELKIKESNYRILRRRVIWLIGKWTGVKFHPDNRPIVYEICAHLMSAEEDFVIRLTAAMTLKTSLDDFEFDADEFMPYMPSAFVLLFNLLKEAHECDTKMQVLDVISFMIEVVQTGVHQHVVPLIQFLPALWEESVEHNMFRCAILTALVRLVSLFKIDGIEVMQHLGDNYIHFLNFLVSIIRIATDTKQPSHVYLLEEGLLLWLTLLENSQSIKEPILALYDNMIPLLEVTTEKENVKLCFDITNALTVLCPQPFLKKYGHSLVKTLHVLTTDLTGEGMQLILKCLEMIMIVLPHDGPKLLQNALPKLVTRVLKEELNFVDLSLYISVLSRTVLCSEESFSWIISKVSEDSNTSPESILKNLLTLWTDRLDFISPEERKKLCALALAHLCGFNWPPILEVWPSAITSITEVIFDLTQEDSVDDKLVFTIGDDIEVASSEGGCDGTTEHEKRIQEFVRNDIVHKISLRNYLGQRLKVFAGTVDSVTKDSLGQQLELDCRKLLTELMA